MNIIFLMMMPFNCSYRNKNGMNKDFIEILREFIPNVPVFTPKYGMIFIHVFS
jgi:hypothetical protein